MSCPSYIHSDLAHTRMDSSLARLVVAICCLLAVAPSLHGQNQPTISTDRPAITASSTTAPQGALLIESGFSETRSQGQSGFDLPETLLRLGLTGKTELRFTAPDYFDNLNTSAGLSSGWGDLSLGIKQQLVSTWNGLDVALVASLSFPTGADAISSHGYDPQLLLPWSLPAFKHWTAAGMVAIFWPTVFRPEFFPTSVFPINQSTTRNLTGQATFMLDRQITSRWDAFIEYAGTFPQRGGTQHVLHAGTAFKITSNQQVDFHSGFGLSAAAVDHFLGFGYSLRLQPMHWKKDPGRSANPIP